MIYRGYKIEPFPNSYPFPFSYVHTGYDGPEDDRHGIEDTVQECKDAIDDWYDDQLFCEHCDSTGIVHVPNRPYPNDPRSIEETFSEECEKCSKVHSQLLNQ